MYEDSNLVVFDEPTNMLDKNQLLKYLKNNKSIKK